MEIHQRETLTWAAVKRIAHGRSFHLLPIEKPQQCTCWNCARPNCTFVLPEIPIHQNDSEPANVMQKNAKLGNREYCSIGSWGYPASDPIVFHTKKVSSYQQFIFSKKKNPKKYIFMFSVIFEMYFSAVWTSMQIVCFCAGPNFPVDVLILGAGIFFKKSGPEKIIFFGPRTPEK